MFISLIFPPKNDKINLSCLGLFQAVLPEGVLPTGNSLLALLDIWEKTGWDLSNSKATRVLFIPLGLILILFINLHPNKASFSCLCQKKHMQNYQNICKTNPFSAIAELVEISENSLTHVSSAKTGLSLPVIPSRNVPKICRDGKFSVFQSNA